MGTSLANSTEVVDDPSDRRRYQHAPPRPSKVCKVFEELGLALDFERRPRLFARLRGRGTFDSGLFSVKFLDPGHPSRTFLLELLQLRVFRLSSNEDGDVGVGVFPEREEILIGSTRFHVVSG